MITRRENFLLALQCQRSERMPVVFVIDNFNYPNDLPPELFDPFDMVRIQRYLGADVIDRIGPSVVVTQNSQVKFTATDRGGGSQLQEWEISLGKLSGICRHSPEAGAQPTSAKY